MNHRARAGRDQPPCDPAPSPNGTAHSAEVCSVPQTEPVFFTKKTLCRLIQISERSWSRAAAAGLTPPPDLVVGREARWSPDTIKKWLRTHPKLPGRGGRRGS